MNQVYKNKVRITSITETETKTYGFGVILEPELRQIYVPEAIVVSHEITLEDVGADFFALFIEQKDRRPLVIALSEEEFNLVPTVLANTAICGKVDAD